MLALSLLGSLYHSLFFQPANGLRGYFTFARRLAAAAEVILLTLCFFIATSKPVGWWAWLTNNLPNDAEAGGGLMVAVIQLSIALGSTLGGLLFDTKGYAVTFVASAGLLFIAALLARASAKYSQA